MKKSATLISTYWHGIISRCRSNVRNFLTMLFLLSGTLFVTQKSDAQSCNSFGIDFRQAANKDGGYEQGEIHWINSILNKNNSRYVEGMSTLQRIVMNNLPACGTAPNQGYHKLRIKMETRKNNVHAYDFITSWDNAILAAAAIAPGFDIFPTSRGDLVNELHECGDEISACAKVSCDLVTGGTFLDLPVEDNETNNLIEGPPADQNTVSQIIPTYETRYGNRTVRVYVGAAGFGGTAADNKVVFAGYGDANAGDGGETYIYYDIMWVSTSPNVVIEYGAHIAVGIDGLAVAPSLGVGYLLNRGASSISGGPYHCIIEDFQNTTNNTPKCEPNLGNLDNQLQGSEILLIPSCNLQGPSAVCGNATATYTAAVTNPDNATYLWEIINTGTQSPAASIIGTASGNVPAPIAPATTTPLSITVNTGGVGAYTVKLTINNGGQTTGGQDPTADDISSSCTVITTVSGGPNITCPTSTATAACQTQAQVDNAYQAWLALATGGGTITHNGGSVGPNRCGGATTVIFTATNTCGTSTCSATFTVTADNTPPVITKGGTTTTLACNPSADDINGALGTATATDNCGSTTVTPSDGSVTSTSCGRSQTRTWLAVDGCGNTATASRTVTWTADVTGPTITTGGGSCSLACNPTAGAIEACLGTATATDACGTPTVTPSDGSVTSDGCSRSQTRTFTARDACGNTSTASRTATWTADANGPTITTGGGSCSLACNPTAGAIEACLGTATATDACGIPTVTPSDGSVTSDGCSRSQTRTFTARDACGNTSTASRTATWVVDVTGPTITTGGGSCSLGCNPSASSINACLGTASASDACSTPTISQSDGSVTSTGCGRSQTRTWTARDACGNTSTASRTATWTSDLTPPTITCSADKTIECGAPIVFDNPTATDNCDASPDIATVSTSPDGLTRIWVATDDCGNTATCDQTITIGDCLENIFPTGTTCEQFQAQNTPTTESLCFSQNNGIVANASAPGAWFYYTYVVKPAGVSTISVRINQTNDGVIAGLFTSDEIKAWTAACAQITRRVTRDFSDPAHPVITIEFVGGAVNSALTLVISAKYNSQSIVGSAVTGTSSVYSFSASRSLDNAAFSVIPNSQESITANECNADLLTVARPPSELVTDQPANQLRVSAFPNPFTDVVKFTINSNISGQAQLEVVNMVGQRIAVVYNGHIEANRNRVVEYKISAPVQQTLIYILRMGGKQVTGKLIKLE